MGLTVFAIGCHPDDIEFMMAGTLILLRDAGCSVHMLNLANGDCGSLSGSRRKMARIRRGESLAAARLLGATLHRSLARDLEVFYRASLIRRVLAMVREVAPDIVLVPSLEDYMEDHMNTARIAVTATFARGVASFRSIPRRKAILNDVAVYHAQPHGLHDSMGNRVRASLYVDVGPVLARKAKMLACHESQRSWLSESQGMDSYTDSMMAMARDMGKESGCFEHAEGWRRHNSLGFSPNGLDPLPGILGERASPRRADNS